MKNRPLKDGRELGVQSLGLNEMIDYCLASLEISPSRSNQPFALIDRRMQRCHQNEIDAQSQMLTVGLLIFLKTITWLSLVFNEHMRGFTKNFT